MDTIISSRQNPLIKQLVHCHNSTNAYQQSGQIVFEGIHLLQMAQQHDFALEKIIVSDTATNQLEIAAFLQQTPTPIWICPGDYFNTFSHLQKSNGILALAKRPLPQAQEHFSTKTDAVYLSGIQDPGNMGTILRAASAMGISQILLGTGNTDIWSKKVLRAGMGAHGSLRFFSAPHIDLWPRTSEQKWLATVVTGGISLPQCHLHSPVLWMFGAEGAGMDINHIQLADYAVSIPQSINVESLNVAVAASICFYETMRQRSSTCD